MIVVVVVVVVVMDQSVAELEKKIGYTFTDKDVAAEALQLAGNGTTVVGGRVVLNGNKRLAVLGNLAVDVVLCSSWYEDGGSEGAWSAMRQSVSSNAKLAQAGKELDLGELLKQNPTNNISVSDRMMATLVEAVVGAVWLDSGRKVESAREALKAMGLIE